MHHFFFYFTLGGNFENSEFLERTLKHIDKLPHIGNPKQACLSILGTRLSRNLSMSLTRTTVISSSAIKFVSLHLI